MTNAANFYKYLIGALLLAATTSTLAVSLGRMRGTAIVGSSFDVTLAAQLGRNEKLSAICVEADVFYGDNLIQPSRVSTAISAGANAGEAFIRVRSSSAVDEPIVTVTMREGCLQKNTRKYVFLAEVLTGRAGDMAASSGEVVSSPPAQLPTAGGPDGNKIAWPTSLGQTETVSPALLRKKLVVDRTVMPPSPDKAGNRLGSLSTRLTATAALTSPGKSSNSRLKLDPLELAAERDPVLRSSPELRTQPSTDAQQRAAAAALWQVLNAEPQNMLRDSQRLKSLEIEVTKMLTQSRAADKAVSELRVQLAQSRSERFSNWLVYALAAILTVTWLVAAFLWARNRREHSEQNRNPWWRKMIEPEDKVAAEQAGSQGLAVLGGDIKTGPAEAANPAKFELDFDLDGNAPRFNQLRDSGNLPPPRR